MQFSLPAPGFLTDAGGGNYFGHWSVAADNQGLTASQVESWVQSALFASDGLTQIPIGFVQDASGGGVVFRSVLDLPGRAIGTSYGATPPAFPHVDLQASYFGNKDLVIHEACHAFLTASHSPEGSVSLMEPIEDPGEEGLSGTDVAQIRAYLALETPPIAHATGTYWHPLNLPFYITRWDLSDATESRVVAPVAAITTAGRELAATLSAVYSTTFSPTLPGPWQPLGSSVYFGDEGFYVSEWATIPAGAKTGEVYIGMTIDLQQPVGELSLGQTELRIR